MKKICFCSIVSLSVICNVYASNNEQIKQLIETIQNVPSGTITATDIPTSDDCTYTLVNKDGIPMFYERACFPIDLRFKDFDSVKSADYSFTIYNGTQETVINGTYDDFKDLIDIIPKTTKPTLVQPELQKSLFSRSCYPYGFDVITESNKDITVTYHDGTENRKNVFSKIYDDYGVKVYFSDDMNIFINNNGKWKNYGHKCTNMKYRSVIQECDSKHKIKIVWFSEIKDPYILADLAADADPWGFSDVALVYQEFDKTPSVFLREAYDSIYFVNGNMRIRYYEEDDGNVKWKTSDTLCKKDIKSQNVPDVLKDEAIKWEQNGFRIEYAGRYRGEVNGYSDVNIYQVVAPDGSKTGFPTVYAIHDNKIIREITNMESMDILKNTTLNLFDDGWIKDIEHNTK